MKASAEKFADEQDHFITLAAFCRHGVQLIYDHVPAAEVEPIGLNDYKPCCSTPLYDAIGSCVTDMEKLIGDNEDAVAHVSIVTDGKENASTDFTCESICDLIDKWKAKGWLFAYLGANQDAEKVAGAMSITNALNFRADKRDTREVFSTLAKAQQRAAGGMRELKMSSEMGKNLSCCRTSYSRFNDNFFNDEDRCGRTSRLHTADSAPKDDSASKAGSKNLIDEDEYDKYGYDDDLRMDDLDDNTEY